MLPLSCEYSFLCSSAAKAVVTKTPGPLVGALSVTPSLITHK